MSRVGRARGWGWGVAALLLLASASAGAQPREPAWFRHTFRRTISNGTGVYQYYNDTTDASGRYEITPRAGGDVEVRGRYSWRYTSPEKQDSGEEDRVAVFDGRTRRYTSERIDLDEYDGKTASELATWLWIPPDTRAGTEVQILERTFRVRARDVRWNVAGDDRVVIRLRAEGTGERHDAYGDFATTFVDEYTFDQATGYFLESHYRETDRGTFEGHYAQFEVDERVTVDEASYAPPDLSGLYATLVCAGVLGALALGLLFWWIHRQRWGRRVKRAGATVIGVQRLRKPVALPPVPEVGVTRWFAPFLPHWIRVALASGDRVVVGTSPGGDRLEGLAIRHQDADAGTILANDSDVCELLRKDADIVNFFSEVRHLALQSVVDAAKRYPSSAPAPPKEAYNLYETYDVLRLAAIPDVSYDADVVARMKPADLEDVDQLSRKVYGVGAKRWVWALLANDEIGFVVRREGKLVAFAMATAAGVHGRLHTNTVDPEHQGRGLGKELMRARLRALRDLGVETVITEIASWNQASLEIAKAHGFEKVGEMYVESAMAVRAERKFVRR